MSNKKIIALDVDGVICLWGSAFEPRCMHNLKEIIDATNASIVVSSTWRLFDGPYAQLLNGLDHYGIPQATVIGKTPDFCQLGARHKEILHWLKENPHVNRFAIIDDDISAAIPDNPESYFRTNFRSGLCKKTKKAIIKYLNEA